MQKTIVAPGLRFGRPEGFDRRPPRRQTTADLTLLTYGPTSSIGFALTPRRVLGVFREAEIGYPMRQCDLFEEIVEKDGHLRSQIETRIDSVAGKDWIVQAGGDEPADHRAAAMLEETLRDVANFGEFIEHQLTAPGYGWAASEMTWDLAANKLVAPLWFSNVPHRMFAFDQYDDLVFRPEGFPIVNGEPLAPGGWVVSRRRHRLTAKAGLLRTAAWWALIKRMSVRDWVAFAERFGLPLPIGKYRDDMPEEEKAALRKAVEMIGRDGYAVFSEAGTIEFAKAEYGAGHDTYPGLCGFANAEISKLITGATLTSGEGSSTGSYALGRVHENVSFQLVLSDATRLGNVFAQQIGRPFLYWNGIKARAPRLRINIVREVEPSARLDILSRAANELGLDLDADQVRQENQIKKPVGEKLSGTKVGAAGRAPVPSI